MADQNNNAAGDAAAQNSVAAKLPLIPDTWPGAFGIYKYSKQAVMLNLSTFIYLLLLSLAIGIVVSIFIKGNAGDFVSTVINIVIEIALITAYLVSVRGNKIDFGGAFKKLTPMLALKFFALIIVTGIIAALSLLALIIPFFFVMPRLILSGYYLIDKDLGILESVQTSWNRSKGNVGKVYGIIGVNILIILLAVTIIGIPFSIYFYVMYAAAVAILYEYINKSAPKAAVAAAPQETPTTPPASS